MKYLYLTVWKIIFLSAEALANYDPLLNEYFFDR